MDLALVSVVADTAAAFGVIGSLIFVGYQVQQNSAGLHNAAAQSLMATYQDLFSNVIDSKDTAEIMHKGFHDLENLDDISLMRFYGYTSKFLRTFQGTHWQWKRGAIDDGLFKSMTTMLEDSALLPGWRHVWRVRRHQYDADFQKFVDKIFAEGKGSPLYPDLASEDDG